jgi:hypothetical protein
MSIKREDAMPEKTIATHVVERACIDVRGSVDQLSKNSM